MNLHEPIIRSDYLGFALDSEKVEEHFTKSIKTLQESNVEFDAIAYTGVSGGLTAPVVAFLLKKPLIVVRKDTDTSKHSPHMIEGDVAATSFIIVDDFKCTGKTRDKIISAVTHWSNAEYKGFLSLLDNDFSSPSEGDRDLQITIREEAYMRETP
jgi:adenine/guanine phosphoribosyltransferase-like PRPP-binding protein